MCHVSKLNRDVITHTLNKTNGSSGPLVIYGLVNSNREFISENVAKISSMKPFF